MIIKVVFSRHYFTTKEAWNGSSQTRGY